MSRLDPVAAPLARSALTGPVALGGGMTMLETVGRSSGLRRERPLLSLRVGDHVVVGTVRRSSDWVRNVRAEPAVHVWLDGERVRADARVLPLPFGWLVALRTDG